PRRRSAGWPARTRTRCSPATAETPTTEARAREAPYDRRRGGPHHARPVPRDDRDPDRVLRGGARPRGPRTVGRVARDVVGQRAPEPRRPPPPHPRVAAPPPPP